MTTRSKDREKFLVDVLVSIVEDGGYNGWRRILHGSYHHDLGSESCATIIELGDGAPEEEAMHDLNLNVIATGIGRLQKGEIQVNSELLGWILAGSAKNDAGDIDAEAADVILQAALFGELVYG